MYYNPCSNSYPKIPRMSDILTRGFYSNFSLIAFSTDLYLGPTFLHGHTVCNDNNGNYSYHGIRPYSEAEKLCELGFWSGFGENPLNLSRSTPGY